MLSPSSFFVCSTLPSPQAKGGLTRLAAALGQLQIATTQQNSRSGAPSCAHHTAAADSASSRRNAHGRDASSQPRRLTGTPRPRPVACAEACGQSQVAGAQAKSQVAGTKSKSQERERHRPHLTNRKRTLTGRVPHAARHGHLRGGQQRPARLTTRTPNGMVRRVLVDLRSARPLRDDALHVPRLPGPPGRSRDLRDSISM